MNEIAWDWLDLGWLLLLLDLTIVAALIPTIILQRRESGATLAWILVIFLVPFVGLLAFWVLGTTRLHLRRRKRRKIEKRLAPALNQLLNRTVKRESGVELPLSLLYLAEKLDDVGPQPGNAIQLYRKGALAFDALESAFDTAKQYIHLVYYVWEDDSTGQRMRDGLARAAARGVEVRLLIDDVGSRGVKGDFFRDLLQAGGQVERFLPVNPLNRQLALNNRNHRKIVVVDGKTGFTGGMNVGDLYAGIASPWLDLHARMRGPVVHSLQEVFSQDWYHATGEDLVNPEYFPEASEAGGIWAQILASGPADERWRAIHTFLFAAITLAQKRLWIETPYFVPDAPLLMALQTAALRGVDVRLLLPGKSDHPLVLHAGRSFLDELLSAGVRVYELYEAMPHAKTATVDGIFATLGSANMDQRSFRLNFEANAFFFGAEVAVELERDFLALCDRAVALTEESRRDVSRSGRLIEGMCRILAPIL
ncbi:MAG: cardiolipin synthase [Gammaproteobacteria bacterium]|nr:cardiolipin synthase [Gammaproteobacteria bacterium]